jgi:hypothetical protein
MEPVLAPDLALTDDSRADAMLTLGMMSFERGDYPRAASVLRPALDLYLQRDDVRGVATASVPLGVMAVVQGSSERDTMLRRAIDDLRRLDDRWELAFALTAFGTALVIGHREADAIAPFEEGADIARTGNDDVLLSNALIGLGWAHIRRHDAEAARAPVNEGLQLAVRVASQETIARALDACAAMAEHAGDARRGAILSGAADGLRRSIGAAVWAIERANHDETADHLHARLGEQTYQQLMSQGATLTLDDVLAIAAGTAR